MTLTVTSAVEHSLEVLCGVINRSFVGYVGGEVNFTPRLLAGFLTQNGIGLVRSLVVLRDDEPAGIALLARRGASIRVGLMGVTQAAQNQGVGRWLLGEIEREARDNGDRMMTLEVIEQNPRAVHLYESYGYRRMRRLLGWTGSSLTGEPGALVRVDVPEAARRITAWGSPDLPWQCSGEAVIVSGPPSAAYRLGSAYAVISSLSAETITISGLAVPPESQRQGVATRLVGALVAAHPGKAWRVPAICPEEYGPVFERNGMTRSAVNQFQMEKAVG
ncbi:MAG: GNAT family N-acetyltransferase [Anaerolineae bacterium]|nr:GNAT family N-acetyltransferase [Anaerolineae bacterium]